jgi:hypothetical protein
LSFAVVVRDVLHATLPESVAIGDLTEACNAVQEALLETLKDPAVRREVFEHAFEEMDDIDMMIVHTVVDGLVKALSEEVTIDG